MVQDTDAENLAGLDQSLRRGNVFLARCDATTWMRVEDDDRDGVCEERGREDTPRFDKRPVDNASIGHRVADDLSLGIEEEGSHHLAWLIPDQAVQESRCLDGAFTVARKPSGLLRVSDKPETIAGDRLWLWSRLLTAGHEMCCLAWLALAGSLKRSLVGPRLGPDDLV